MENNSLFNKLYWENRYHVQKLARCFTLYRKINSTWTKDLNVRPETMKLLEKHISRHLLDISPAIYIDIGSDSKLLRLCQTKKPSAQ